MANRVLLGERGGVYGLWVSRPGTNVASTGDANMLLATNRPMLQIVQSGSYTDSMAAGAANLTRDVAIPNLGFEPFVLVVDDQFTSNITLRWRSLNNTTLRFTVFGTANAYTVTWQYAVFNIPRS